MTSLVNKIMGAMPCLILTRIVGVPEYEVIKIVNDELTRNAVTFTTNLGCGTVGYTRLTLTAAIYANISIAAWIPPPDPGAQALIPIGSTSPQITPSTANSTKSSRSTPITSPWEAYSKNNSSPPSTTSISAV